MQKLKFTSKQKISIMKILLLSVCKMKLFVFQ